MNLAQTVATEEALEALPEFAAELDVDASVADRTRDEYQEHLRDLRATSDESGLHPTRERKEQYRALRLALLGHKRMTVIRLRDEEHIDDTVLGQIQRRLDIEDVRLSQGGRATEPWLPHR